MSKYMKNTLMVLGLYLFAQVAGRGVRGSDSSGRELAWHSVGLASHCSPFPLGVS